MTVQQPHPQSSLIATSTKAESTVDDKDDSEDEEDDILKWVEDHIEKEGHVTVKDIKHMVVKKLEEEGLHGKVLKKHTKMIMKEVKKGFKECDENGDKKVDGEEFKKCMEKYERDD